MRLNFLYGFSFYMFPLLWNGCASVLPIKIYTILSFSYWFVELLPYVGNLQFDGYIYCKYLFLPCLHFLYNAFWLTKVLKFNLVEFILFFKKMVSMFLVALLCLRNSFSSQVTYIFSYTFLKTCLSQELIFVYGVR